jgi:hypothetical protein
MSEFLTGLHVSYHVALNIPAVRAGAAGAVSAALIDFAAFRSFKSWHDLAAYDWGVASFRWVAGFVTAALTSFGLGTL